MHEAPHGGEAVKGGTGAGHTAPQWIDVSKLPFDVMLLLEYRHLQWFPRRWPGNELGIALRHNRHVLDFFRLKVPEDRGWIDELAGKAGSASPEAVRAAEIAVMRRICDWLVYVLCPEEYDRQPFLRWDDRELLGLADWKDKVVADIGSGTGRLLEPVIGSVRTAYAVEPVERLRRHIKSKFALWSGRLFVLDGVIEDIPLPSASCDVVLSGHVFGDRPEEEMHELERVARDGGTVILCPGNNDSDNEAHRVLEDSGYEWSVFREPVDGPKRKYWKTVFGAKGGAKAKAG